MTISKQELLSLLVASAYKNYCSSLCSGAQIIHQRFEFFKNIKPGDLVMEVSSIHMRSHDQYRIGYLVSDAMEPYGTDEWWEENKEDYGDQARPQERVYNITCLLSGQNFRWTNASMIRVVTKLSGEFP